MKEAAITTPQLVGWILTGLGIFASLAWNLFNQIRTTRTAESLRAEQYKGAQWTRIHGRIDSALDGFVDLSKSVIQQALGLDSGDLKPNSFDLFNQIVIDAQDGLACVLEEAALSRYCSGQHWRDAANGPMIGTETAWDVVLAKFEEARSADTLATQVVALTQIREPISQIRTQVLECCRVQDLEYDPDKI